LSGNAHDQQISVIGFMNLPVQVVVAAHELGETAKASTRTARMFRSSQHIT